MTDNKYLNAIKNSTALVDSSKDIYLSKLHVIQYDIWKNCKSTKNKIGKGKCLNYIIKHPEAFMEKLDEFVNKTKGRLDDNKLSMHAKDGYVSAITAIFRNTRGMTHDKPDLYQKWIDIHKKFNTSVMASMKVNKKDISRWGVYDVKKKIDNNNFIIKSVVEKPSIKTAPSNNVVIGRYILTKKIFNKLLKLKPGKGGEIHITDAIQNLINDNEKFIGHNFSGKYLDCGTMKGYINSTLEISKI